LEARLLWWARGAVAAVLGVTVSAWAGWMTGRQYLTRIFASWPVMTPWTAVLLSALGVSILVQLGVVSGPRVWFGRAVAVAAGAVAVVFLLAYATGRSPGVDLLWFGDEVRAVQETWPGRPSPPTSSTVALLAVAVGLTSVDQRWARVARAMGLAFATGLAFVSIGAYLFGALSIVTVTPSTGVAISTALCLTLLGLAAVLARPDLNPVAWMLQRPDRASLVQLAGVVGAIPVMIALIYGALVLRLEQERLAWAIAVLSATAVAGIALFFVFDRERRTRLATEARLESIVANAPNPVAIRTPGGGFDYVNQGFSDIWGQKYPDQILGKTPRDLAPLDAELGRKLTEVEAAVMRGETSAFEHIFPGFGDPVTVEFQLFPVRDASGKVVNFGAIGTDVTARDRQEQALRRATARAKAAMRDAEAANRAKTSFLATMSHELRTPLNAILGFSDLLRRDPTLSSGQRDELDIISRSGMHLLGLINQVLDMAKIESGQTVAEMSAVDLPMLVDDVDAMMRTRAESAGLQFVVEVADDVPRYIRSDGQKLRQILLNLVGNSLKFTTEGGVSARVKTSGDTGSSTHAGLRLVIEVEDSGAGIPAAQQQRIFEPFVQLNERGGAGTGLGLSIVREYARLLGGTVEVRSEVGSGSLFRVNLPVEVAKAEEVTTVDESRHVVGLAPGQPDWRVLVVEDDPVNRILLGGLLEDVGFTVAFAENGAECLKVFGEFRPHFIWMDRRMPVMDGLEATSLIRAREDGGEVKIAALTASVFEEQREEWVRAGIDGFVRKPFRQSEIFDCMHRLLGVDYLYREQAQQNQVPSGAELSRELAKLPASVRAQLTEALILGATARLAEVLQEVRPVSAELAGTLEQAIADFNYALVLDALDAVEPDGTNDRRPD